MMKRLGRIVVFYLLPLVLFVAAGSLFTVVVARQRPDVLGIKSSEQVSETALLLKKVSQLIALPQDENPTFATITDVSKLPTQPIFAHAQVGDKVLVYPRAKQIVVYRPERNTIVDYGSVETQNEVSSVSAQLVATPSARIVVISESETSLATVLKSQEPTLNVVAKQQLLQNDYPQTLIIDLKATQWDLVKKIATDMGFVASTWPEVETKPANADIVIIEGADWINR